MSLELILGGARSGKSRYVLQQALACQQPVAWIATAEAHDDEMQARIERHRNERPPNWQTLETPLYLAQALQKATGDFVVVDCLTLWLTNLLMPADAAYCEENRPPAPVEPAQKAPLLIAIAQAAGPVVLVGNEIGLGVIPMGREVRAFVDALGRLNQDVAAACQRVTLMAAGLPLTLKETT